MHVHGPDHEQAALQVGHRWKFHASHNTSLVQAHHLSLKNLCMGLMNCKHSDCKKNSSITQLAKVIACKLKSALNSCKHSRHAFHVAEGVAPSGVIEIDGHEPVHAMPCPTWPSFGPSTTGRALGNCWKGYGRDGRAGSQSSAALWSSGKNLSLI